jgi:hypothetical protein
MGPYSHCGRPWRQIPLHSKKRSFSADQQISLEITSDQARSDRNRMLLQAACLARLGNAPRRNPGADPFIVSAVYIDNKLRAIWYLLYQPNVSDTTVRLILQGASSAETQPNNCFISFRSTRCLEVCSYTSSSSSSRGLFWAYPRVMSSNIFRRIFLFHDHLGCFRLVKSSHIREVCDRPSWA